MTKKKTQELCKIRAKTVNQGRYYKAVETSDITICTGPSGTGKSYMACGIASDQLLDGRIEKIVISRPLVTCGNKNIGAFPGNVEEKFSPYMSPLLDAFEDFIDGQTLRKFIREGIIELLPMELMRGSSIKHSFIICDEAQNATYQQLRMLLTRIGERSRMVITGDIRQVDTNSYDCALENIIKRFEKKCHDCISIVRLYKEDIVRHPLIKWIEERLDDYKDDFEECNKRTV